MSTETADQALNVTPARANQVIALSVDGTSRAYDLTGLTFDGAHNDPQHSDHIYLTLQADGSDIYYVTSALDSGSAVAIDETAAITVGSPLVYNSSYPVKIVSGLPGDPIRIDRTQDRTLVVKCGSGKTSTLRLWASSQRAGSAVTR